MVPVPPTLASQRLAAYDVSTADLAPRIEPGDVVFVPAEPLADYRVGIGHDAVCELPGGARLLRRIEHGFHPACVTLTAPGVQALSEVPAAAVRLWPVVAVVKRVGLELLELAGALPRLSG